jgi:hypothetical protein
MLNLFFSSLLSTNLRFSGLSISFHGSSQQTYFTRGGLRIAGPLSAETASNIESASKSTSKILQHGTLSDNHCSKHRLLD